MTDTELLVLRPEDLLVLGVRWTGMTVLTDAATASSAIEAITANSTVIVSFPPQHVVEQVLADGSTPPTVDGRRVFQSRLSGSSQLSFRLPLGSRITLTVDSLLTALTTLSLVSDGTSVELPYRVAMSPASGATFRHPSAEVSSPTGTVGLWRTALMPGADGRPLRVTAIPTNLDPDPFPSSLTADNRLAIANGGVPLVVDCARLELSALGGSLAVHGGTSAFDWMQQIALGRDVHVRTATFVRLYPFNHRAVFIETTDRVFDALGADQAALKKDRRLVILERFVDLPVADQLGRQFPFHRVEILDTVLPQVAEPNWTKFRRPSLILDALRADLQSTEQARNSFLFQLAPELQRDRSLQELIDVGFGPALDLAARGGAIDEANTALGALEDALNAAIGAQQQIKDLNKRLDDILARPQGPDGPDPADAQAIQDINDQISALAETAALSSPAAVKSARARRDALVAAAGPVQQQVDAEQRRDRTPEELDGTQFPQAVEVIRLRQLIADLQQQIEDQVTAAAVPTDWFFVPSTGTGVPVPFSLRISGLIGDLVVPMPLIAINDVELAETPGFAAFRTLTDPLTDATVGKLWADSGFGTVAFPATPVGLIRSSTSSAGSPADPPLAGTGLTLLDASDPLPLPIDPAAAAAAAAAAVKHPGDIQELHGFTIAGALGAAGYRPKLDSFTVGLPEVRTLLNQVDLPKVSFTNDYLTRGDAEDLAYRLLGDDPLDLDFRGVADRAGALVSPRILADGLSRQFGPAAIDGIKSLVGDKFDAKKLLADGASILGFDLRDLVGAVDFPPAITADLGAGGVPVVTMTWSGVPLKSPSGSPFVAKEGEASLVIKVVSSPGQAKTTCTLHHVGLSLPTPSTQLLLVTFEQIAFTQELGRAPDLSISRPTLLFTDKLKLVQALQQAVDLGSKGPQIEASSKGVIARYSLPVPEVSTGSFVMRNIVFRAGLEVPFTGDPVVISLGFASREQPFNLSVQALGGGGYVQLQLDHTGLRSIEAALEFGATIAVNFGIVTAEVHALAGIQYALRADKTIDLAGYLRIGGTVNILGLISVSVELRIELHYEPDGNEMVGRATLVVDIDLTLYSHKVELDSGRWAISGSDLPLFDTDSTHDRATEGGVRALGLGASTRVEDDRAVWEAYRKAFVS